jgi:hypothetical protein
VEATNEMIEEAQLHALEEQEVPEDREGLSSEEGASRGRPATTDQLYVS